MPRPETAGDPYTLDRRRFLQLVGMGMGAGLVAGPGTSLLEHVLLGHDPAAWAAGPIGANDGVLVVIGMFGAFGTSKAIAFGIPPVPAVFIGACAAVGGGVLRDMLMGLPTAIMHVGSLYAVAAGAGCTFIVIANGLGMPITLAAIIGIVVTAVIRILAVSFDVSLPEQRRIYRRKVAAETGMIPIIKTPEAEA